MKPKYAKVEGNPNMIRDLNSNAILYVNDDEYKRKRREREILQKKAIEQKIQKEEINNLRMEVNEIKNSISEILKILKGQN